MLLIRHNLDVMHIEKNVFDNIFNTVMDIKGKTKDNINASRGLKIICNRPELELDKRRPNVMPKAVYTLENEQKTRVCEWIRGLKFLDGYASNLARCVNMTELRMHGMKSHNCYIFMQKLIPIAFCEMLPEHVRSALIKVGLLFQSICSTTLDVRKLNELENNVDIILCNLEKIFLPAIFDSMEHLIVHLPYEARVRGPVQYRWMYPFERFLRKLKKKVKNKAFVEASIVEAYIVEEIGMLGLAAVGATSSQVPARGMHHHQQHHQRHSFPHRLKGITSASRMRDPTGASAILVPEAEGGTATMRACSSSSSRRPRSSCGSGLPTTATSWPDRCGWPRRYSASFCSSARAQNFRRSRPRIRSTGWPTRKQQRSSTAETQLEHSVNQMEVFEKVYKKKNDGQWSGPREKEVAKRTAARNRYLVSSLRDPLRAAAVDVSSYRSKKGPSNRSPLRGPPHDCWTIIAQQLHCSYTLAATTVE
ncbi:hypothetical protein Sango_2718800 [Sesamum angolense]|uniref:DUF4218 domain-containing protein n=1 Tax=Sesamum angolense TaxID=2727404 RepID=A0AAE1W3D9_9LAMI|nr:hypothetical protein Sango_2718800 [Sesamum angolense]